MRRYLHKPAALVLGVLFLSSCASVEKRYVSIKPPAPGIEKREGAPRGRVTVNDFTDVRKIRDTVGLDYTGGTDIVSMEPVGVGVAESVGTALRNRGIGVVRIHADREPREYASQFDADFHLSGEIEELKVTVKKKGVLLDIRSTGEVRFSLHDGRGEKVWAGRMEAETSASRAFLSTKAIEESLNECVKLLGDSLAGDETFNEILKKGPL